MTSCTAPLPGSLRQYLRLDLSAPAFCSADSPWATTAGPSARANAGVAYDPTGHRLIVFGGNASSSGMSYIALNDTWTLSLVNGQWTQITTTGAPSPRLFQSALWDDTRQRLVVHGGADEGAFFDTAQYYDEVYALDVDSACDAAVKRHEWIDTTSASFALVNGAAGARHILSAGR